MTITTKPDAVRSIRKRIETGGWHVSVFLKLESGCTLATGDVRGELHRQE
jgi:hypothetical protein